MRRARREQEGIQGRWANKSNKGQHVRIREFMTRFTRFSLEIRKTILFYFRVFSGNKLFFVLYILQEILDTNKQEGTEGNISRTLETATNGTTVDTLCALVEICWQSLTHKSHSQVRRILAFHKLGYYTLSEGTDSQKTKE